MFPVLATEDIFKLNMQLDLEGEDRAVHVKWAGWKGLRAKIVDHFGDKGDVVGHGKVLQLGCGCDSIRVMRGKLLYQRYLNS